MQNTKKNHAIRYQLLTLFVIVIASLSMSACSNSTEETTGSNDSVAEASSEFSDEMTLDLSFGTRTGVYSGEKNEDGLPDGYGTFTTESSDGVKYTYEGEWKNGHFDGQGKTTWETGQYHEGMYENDYRNGEGTMLYEDGSLYEGNFVDDLQDGQGKTTFTDGTSYEGNYSKGAYDGVGKYDYGNGLVYEGEFSSNAPKGEGKLTFADNSYLVGEFDDLNDASGMFYSADGTEYYATVENGEVTLTPVNDFFSDDERQEFYDTCYKSYQYKELYDYVENYINGGEGTSETDSAYSILEILEPIVNYQASSWTVSIDEFDGSTIITYDGATQLSNSCSIEIVDDSDISFSARYKIGFRKDGWLMFDRYSLSINGEQVATTSVKNTDTTRNIISGNTIEEYCFANFNSDPWSEIEPEDTVILRFTNSTSEENYDHTLTEDEKNAIYCCTLVHNCRKDLVALQKEYNDGIQQ